MTSDYDAVIIGGGPRAIATVLRIAVRSTTNSPELPAPRIALVDRIHIGAGATWRPDQPAAFLNNTTAGETTIHPDNSTAMTGPEAPGPTLVQWCEQVVREQRTELGAWVLTEAASVHPTVFPSRRLQGIYFRDQLDAVLARGDVSADEYLATAVDIDTAGDLRRVRLEDGRVLSAPTIVLAQGMVQALPDADVARLSDAAERHGLEYVPPGMPAERRFTEHAAGETVLMRGLGANFFDIAGLLADHWGGRFEPVEGDPHRRLRYLPTGREAHVVAGSGRGFPYRSKPDGSNGPGKYTARYATPEWFADQKARRGLDFIADVWPTVAKDLAFSYLQALSTQNPGTISAGWLQELDAASTLTEIDAVLARTVLQEHQRFLIDQLTHPAGREPLGETDWNALVSRWIREELASMSEAAAHPRGAVNNAMSALRRQIGGLRQSLSGASLSKDLHGWFERVHLSLASGPPADRVRRVYAMVEAGVIEFIGPHMTIEVDEQEATFIAHSAQTGRSVPGRVLIDARMSTGNVPRTDDPLLQNLLASGRARIHAVDGVATTSVEASEAEIDENAPHGLNLVDSQGAVDPAVVVLGIPANSTQPGSAIGATPGRPSPLLAGADIAAKQVLLRRRRSSSPPTTTSVAEFSAPTTGLT